MRPSELMKDPDAGGKLSAGRAPLVIWFFGVTLFAALVGAVLVFTSLAASFGWLGVTEPVTYDVFAPFMDRSLDALWALGAVYLGGKATGKIPKALREAGLREGGEAQADGGRRSGDRQRQR